MPISPDKMRAAAPPVSGYPQTSNEFLTTSASIGRQAAALLRDFGNPAANELARVLHGLFASIDGSMSGVASRDGTISNTNPASPDMKFVANVGAAQLRINDTQSTARSEQLERPMLGRSEDRGGMENQQVYRVDSVINEHLGILVSRDSNYIYNMQIVTLGPLVVSGIGVTGMPTVQSYQYKIQQAMANPGADLSLGPIVKVLIMGNTEEVIDEDTGEVIDPGYYEPPKPMRVMAIRQQEMGTVFQRDAATKRVVANTAVRPYFPTRDGTNMEWFAIRECCPIPPNIPQWGGCSPVWSVNCEG